MIRVYLFNDEYYYQFKIINFGVSNLYKIKNQYNETIFSCHRLYIYI